MINSKRKQSGLSLIELMIATGLSAILVIGVIQIFSSSKQTSRVQDSLSRLQENARFALDLLASDIRMAGQLGCDSSIEPADNTGVLRTFGNGIFGYEHDDLPAASADPATAALLINENAPNKSKVVADTDTIVVMRASTNSIPISSAATTATAMNAGAFADLATGDPLLVGDCDTADIIIANKTDSSNIDISTGNFSKDYDDYSQLAPLNYSAYYIREKDNQPNLYRSIVTSNSYVKTEPLLEGVEDMQILYGEDINGDGSTIRYVASDDATALNWNMVTSVRIHLLLATLEDNLATEPQSYWFNGTYQTAADGDKRLFRSFTTTTKLRN